jgi:hypothetical protein
VINDDGVEVLVNSVFVGIPNTCEAGLFDASFVCDSTDVKRYQSATCVVRLCDDHAEIISIPPIAGDDDDTHSAMEPETQ